MIDCLEGDGTEDSPSRIVHYIYDDNADRMIGKIDPMDSFSRIKILENKIESIWGEACPEGCIFCEEIRYRCEDVLPRLTPPTKELLD